MCEKCLKEEFPNRDRMCLDSGVYMANLKCCCECQSNQVSVLNKTVLEDDGVEVTVFEHVCNTCQHVISVHNYKFWVEGDYQEYEMDCALCGTAEDSISILPDDPRKASLDFY
uniref:Protein Churchill n=1 Tax=Daphnia galeata TaxID=27404 RepID=A0A8J2S1N9_9CRUS|nr:unnamed protein product [Daphnia galeata]